MIALCDTNNESNYIDLVVPCNNKGKKSLGLFFYVLAREYLKSRSLIKTENYEKAITVLLQLDKDFDGLTNIQKLHMKSYLEYEWALYWFEQNQFDKAITLVKQSINNYQAELDIYLTNSLLLLGNIHDVNGNRSKAKIAYKKCIKLDNNSEAVRLAKIYVDNPYKK